VIKVIKEKNSDLQDQENRTVWIKRVYNIACP